MWAGLVSSLHAATAPSATVQPSHPVVNLGDALHFTVTATGTSPFSYQWRFNGSNIANATATSLVLSNVQAVAAGTYSVVVSNLAGSTIGNARLIVSEPQLPEALDATNLPWNFSFTAEGYPKWFGQTNITIDGDAAQLGFGDDWPMTSWMEADVTGPGSLAFSWKINAYAVDPSGDRAGNIRLSLDGADQNIVLANITDWTTQSVAVPEGGHTLRWEYVGASDPGFYAWVDRVLYPDIGPPIIAVEPTDQTASVGDTVSLSAATAGHDIGYQWRFNDTDIAGATDCTYSITNVRYDHAGSYKLFLTNSFGATNTVPAVLTVVPTLADALDTTNWTWSSGGTKSADKWHSQTAVTFDAEDAVQAPAIRALAESSALETFVMGSNVMNFWFKIEEDGNSLHLSVDGVEQWSSTGVTDWQEQSVVLSPGYKNVSFRLRNSSTNTTQGLVWLDQITLTPPEFPSIITQPAGSTVVQGSNYVFIVEASGTALTYQWAFDGNPIPGATFSTYGVTNAQATNDGIYSVTVANVAGAETSDDAVLTVEVPPVVAVQPQSQTVIQGANVFFSATASGTEPLTYQWCKNGLPLNAQTNASCSISNVQVTHAGTYTVVVSNNAGTVRSAGAALVVKLLVTTVTVGSGSMTPTPNVLVMPGSMQIFKAAAATNYTVGEWYTNGVMAQSGGTNFVLRNIQRNYSVKVVFRPLIKLYWQHTNGANVEWRMNGTNLLGIVALPWISSAWQMVGERDFNFDANTDLLFQHTDGRLLLRTMKGTSIVRDDLVRAGQPVPAGWKVKAASDLTGDAHADFLFQTATNRLAAWFMNKGTNFLSSVLLQQHNSGWRVVGMADFNADTKNDVLWQNSLGNVLVWFMNGRTNVGLAYLRNGQTAAAGWNISALADLDFNGQKDILLQNGKGQVAVWLMKQTNYLGTVLLRNGQTNAPGWELKGPK